MKLHQTFDLLKLAASKWSDRNAPRLGASLAYYTLLSMAPLVILVVAICGLVFTKSTAEQNVLQQAQDLVGYSGAKTIKSLIDSSQQTRSGLIASIVAILTLLFGASGVFIELRDSLNFIWDAPKSRSSGISSVVTQRLVGFGMVLALGFLLLVSLVLSAALGVIERFFSNAVPLNLAIIGETANVLVSLVAISVLFALIFKFVPDVRINWRDVLVGAIVTAILFIVGRAVLALYLSTAGIGSTYGAAGSLVALVVWVYYSAQIFFFGAVFTRVYADQYGSHSSSPAGVTQRAMAANESLGKLPGK